MSEEKNPYQAPQTRSPLNNKLPLVRNDYFEQLESMLRNWSVNGDAGPGPGQYDFVGVFSLFEACLDNLQCHASEADLEDINGFLNETQRAFLKRLADSASDNFP